jgi:hypothetical protein
MREVPVRDGKKSKPADCHAATRGPIEVREAVTVKPANGSTVTEIPFAPFTVLDSVEAEAAVPVTVTTKLVTVGSGLQLTEIRPAVLTVAVQPAG